MQRNVQLRRRARRGITLIETMIALVVLVTGIAAVFGMVIHVKGANSTMLLQTRSLDVYGHLAAQIANAQCDYNPVTPPPLGSVDPATTDPGLTVFGVPIDQSNRNPASSINFVGITDGTPANGNLPITVPQMQISYIVNPDANVYSGVAGEVPSLDIQITVQEITHDPALDTTPTGYHVRVYPLRKTCNARLDETKRGEYIP